MMKVKLKINNSHVNNREWMKKIRCIILHIHQNITANMSKKKSFQSYFLIMIGFYLLVSEGGWLVGIFRGWNLKDCTFQVSNSGLVGLDTFTSRLSVRVYAYQNEYIDFNWHHEVSANNRQMTYRNPSYMASNYWNIWPRNWGGKQLFTVRIM